MRTTIAIGVDIHFGPEDIRHKYHPADDKCHAYGVLKIDNGSSTYANLYFDTDGASVDKMIAELVALKQEMDPPGCTCDIASADQCKVHRRAYGFPEPNTVTEFTSDSRLTAARCLKPGEHSDNLAGAVVDCDRPEHHEPAPSAAQDPAPVATRDGLCEYCQVEPATVQLTNGRYCEACAPAVQLATGAGVAEEDVVINAAEYREPAQGTAEMVDEPSMCDSELPLKHGGVLGCTLDQGHYGAHSALAGKYRWLGHGNDARDEEGNRIAPLSVAS